MTSSYPINIVERIMRTLLFFLIGLALPALSQAQPQLSGSVFGAAAIVAEHASMHLAATFGQPFVGTATVGTYILEAGFWFVDGAQQATPIAPDDAAEVPTEVKLQQNYPNPFNPQTTIGYALPRAAYVRLTVYDARGREVARLVDQREAAGRYTVTFEARDLSSGVYFYRLEADASTRAGTMLLLK